MKTDPIDRLRRLRVFLIARFNVLRLSAGKVESFDLVMTSQQRAAKRGSVRTGIIETLTKMSKINFFLFLPLQLFSTHDDRIECGWESLNHEQHC